LGIPELLILFIIFLPAIILSIAAWWRIPSKAGHPGILSLAMLVPVVSFLVFLWFAFTAWPIEAKTKAIVKTAQS
jgi:hypothetical protein